MIKKLQIKFAFQLLLLVLVSVSVRAQVDFSTGSSYKYLKGENAKNIGSMWMNSEFDDSSWLTGDSPFRYGDGDGGTLLSDMQGGYSTIFIRSVFEVQNASDIRKLTVRADYDDGFVLFINGVEVVNRNAPNTLSYDALSTDLHEYGEVETLKFDTDNLNLTNGINTIAVFACNTTLSESSDFYFDMSMSGVVSEPEQPDLTDTIMLSFDTPSGFYDNQFSLTVTSDDPDAIIVYTLDGSNPQNSATKIDGGTIAKITINPLSTNNRGKTPGVVVRASAKKNAFKASLPSSRTYIFLDHVSLQSDNPGWDWPTYDVNGQVIDLGIDAGVSQSGQYKSKMEEAMLQIPSISVVTDNANLFDPAEGIYVNAMNDGAAWERECSVELLNPDKTEGFSTNAGLRIRGGWSRHENFPRHGFRLFFRGEYGDKKLNYPLFDEAGADKFDKVDLRCAQNYSWANGDSRHTYVREVFNRDTQGKMGHLHTRSRYYHLYLNGMYWGIYQTQERADAYFAKSYLGGDSEDYDVIKVGGVEDKDLNVTDGTSDSWKEVWNQTLLGYSTNEKYFFLEGKNAKGERIKDAKVLVDIDNLIDYMINIFYTGNFDSPVSKWGGNKTSNNFYMLNNRTDNSTGFQFLVHDSEHTMIRMDDVQALDVNRVDIGYRSGDDRMEVWNFNGFHPQWLHHKLSDNEEYLQRFADRAYQHLEGNGLYTEEKLLEGFNNRVDEIDMAIIGESARWGYGKTKDNAWIPELDVIRDDYFPYRTDIVIDQLLEVDLYSSLSAPSLSKDGQMIKDLVVQINEGGSLEFSNKSGDIYYTMDGKDPRKIGGAVYAYAKKIESGGLVDLTSSAIIKARSYKDGKWSALKEVKLIAEQTDFSYFKITELHYHPMDSIVGNDTIEASNYEFVEFKNTSHSQAINLSGVVIDSAINYTFPENSILAPQQYFVIAAKPKKYYDRYGLLADGNSSSSLSNGGERFQVRDKDNNIIIDFIYEDLTPWPEMPDGQGPSLVSVFTNPTKEPSRPTYWTSSSQIHGSPGVTDVKSKSNTTSIGEEFISMINVYPNPSKGELNISLTDSGEEDFVVELYQMNGVRIFSENHQGLVTYSLSSMGLNHGVYMLKITKGSDVVTHKVVYTPY